MDSKVCHQQMRDRVALPFKDQISEDIVNKKLKDLSLRVHTTIQPVFVSRKIEQEPSLKKTKPQIVNQQCVVYSFHCDQCDAGYVGYVGYTQIEEPSQAKTVIKVVRDQFQTLK